MIDTLEVAVDTVKTVVETTASNVTNVPFWQDKALMEVIGIVGGIIVLLLGFYIWDVISDKKNKKGKS